MERRVNALVIRVKRVLRSFIVVFFKWFWTLMEILVVFVWFVFVISFFVFSHLPFMLMLVAPYSPYFFLLKFVVGFSCFDLGERGLKVVVDGKLTAVFHCRSLVHLLCVDFLWLSQFFYFHIGCVFILFDQCINKMLLYYYIYYI